MTDSLAFATAIVDGLVAAGVREIVLCPGSRSSPLAYAAWSAEHAGRLRLHVRVDERSAGFLALGLAKTSRVPAAVVTTSGTAVANLHPAVLEAHHARVPLVVVSADRPAALRGTGANQTTIQPGIFGVAVHGEWDLAAAEAGPALGEVLTAVVASASTGPVHLNVQFAPPLVPVGPLPPMVEPVAPIEPPSAARRSSDRVATPPAEPSLADPTTSDRFPALTGRTLVVLGDLPDPADAELVLDWAGAQGLPVVAEPFGRHGTNSPVPHGVLLLGSAPFLDAHLPENVLVVGRPTLSRPVARLLQRTDVKVMVAAAGLEFEVPGRQVTHLPLRRCSHLPRLFRAPGTLQGASEREAADPGRSRWRESWMEAGGAVARAIAADPPAWGTGPALARALVANLPDDALLFVGSSNSPRDLDVAVTGRAAGVTVVAGRGLAGIDGCVSTAIGISLSDNASHAGKPRSHFALMGDLTFLHDANGLLIGPDELRPDLTIVVANDDGGGIFTTLEPGQPDLAEPFERLFGTPTGTDLSALSLAHGIAHTRADSEAALAAALGTRPHGIRVVEVAIRRETHRAERARLQAMANAALG